MEGYAVLLQMQNLVFSKMGKSTECVSDGKGGIPSVAIYVDAVNTIISN